MPHRHNQLLIQKEAIVSIDTQDYYKTLANYATTVKQVEALKLLEEGLSKAKAAKKVGMDDSNFRRMIRTIEKTASKQGYAPQHDMIKTCPDGYVIKGVSTLYTNGEDGTRVAAQWVKTSQDQKQQLDSIKSMIETWSIEAKGSIKPTKAPKTSDKDLMTVYPMGDPHVGMYAWGEETGADFDLEIAENQIAAAIDYLVDKSPNSYYGVLANLGDMFHSDNMEGVTARSKHSLDMDGRLQKVIAVGVRSIRRCIHRMLEKHQEVHIVNVPGNHDHVLALALNVMMSNIYENEPRVIVHGAPTMRHYIQHGKVLLGFVHGHQTKDTDLNSIMATERSAEWGQTDYRYFYRGHHHQDKVLDLRGCKVEQFRTLAPKDAYAAGGGYFSGQDMKAIVHHAQHGEIARHTFAISMFE
jgi:hypothetical protein